MQKRVLWGGEGGAQQSIRLSSIDAYLVSSAIPIHAWTSQARRLLWCVSNRQHMVDQKGLHNQHNSQMSAVEVLQMPLVRENHENLQLLLFSSFQLEISGIPVV